MYILPLFLLDGASQVAHGKSTRQTERSACAFCLCSYSMVPVSGLHTVQERGMTEDQHVQCAFVFARWCPSRVAHGESTRQTERSACAFCLCSYSMVPVAGCTRHKHTARRKISVHIEPLFLLDGARAERKRSARACCLCSDSMVPISGGVVQPSRVLQSTEHRVETQISRTGSVSGQ